LVARLSDETQASALGRVHVDEAVGADSAPSDAPLGGALGEQFLGAHADVAVSVRLQTKAAAIVKLFLILLVLYRLVRHERRRCRM
jgi:hypothetical protein